MRALNVVIIVLLISFVVIHFRVAHDTDERIETLNQSITIKETLITNLETTNTQIDSTLIPLKDSISYYKGLLIAYKDSLNNISNNYEVAIKHIGSLSDSVAVINFELYTAKHAERFGISIN